MKAFLKFLVRAVVWALFFAWQFSGVAGAGNVIKFYVLAAGLLLVVSMFTTPDAAKAGPKSGPIACAIYATDHLAMVLALAWVGSFGLAAWWLLALFGGLVYRHKLDAARAGADQPGVPA